MGTPPGEQLERAIQVEALCHDFTIIGKLNRNQPIQHNGLINQN